MLDLRRMNNDEWLQLAATVCADAGIEPGSIEVVRTWEDTQNTVYRLEGQRYLKLYHRLARSSAARSMICRRSSEPNWSNSSTLKHGPTSKGRWYLVTPISRTPTS